MKIIPYFKIYLVDDDEIYLSALEQKIKENSVSKIKIEKFINGEDCLKGLSENPNLIVLDYFLSKQLKGINGLDILRKIKRSNKDLKVIMLSGQDQMNVAINSIKYGAYDYIVKNETSFIKIQNSINNIIHNNNIKEQARKHKNRFRIAGAALVSLVIVLITFSFYYLFR